MPPHWGWCWVRTVVWCVIVIDLLSTSYLRVTAPLRFPAKRSFHSNEECGSACSTPCGRDLQVEESWIDTDHPLRYHYLLLKNHPPRGLFAAARFLPHGNALHSHGATDMPPRWDWIWVWTVVWCVNVIDSLHHLTLRHCASAVLQQTALISECIERRRSETRVGLPSDVNIIHSHAVI
jgi:hypothetical protein